MGGNHQKSFRPKPIGRDTFLDTLVFQIILNPLKVKIAFGKIKSGMGKVGLLTQRIMIH